MPNPIVTCARTWLGTRFHHQGRLKKTATHPGGVDCLGLLVGVASELNLQKNGIHLATCDQTDYGHLPDTRYLHHRLNELLTEIPLSEKQPGDIALLEIDSYPQHLGILTDYDETGNLGLIHAYAPARKVVEHRLSEKWKEKIKTVFRSEN